MIKALLIAVALVGCSSCAHTKVPAGKKGGQCIMGTEHNGNFFAKCDPGLACYWNDPEQQWQCDDDTGE